MKRLLIVIIAVVLLGAIIAVFFRTQHTASRSSNPNGYDDLQPPRNGVAWAGFSALPPEGIRAIVK